MIYASHYLLHWKKNDLCIALSFTLKSEWFMHRIIFYIEIRMIYASHYLLHGINIYINRIVEYLRSFLAIGYFPSILHFLCILCGLDYKKKYFHSRIRSKINYTEKVYFRIEYTVISLTFDIRKNMSARKTVFKQNLKP